MEEDSSVATSVFVKRAAFGRASSSTRTVVRIGDAKSPPHAPDIPLSVLVAAMSSLSLCRSEIQVPSPPPIIPRPASGPRLAPPTSDTSETTTPPGTVEGSTWWAFSSRTRPGSFTGRRNARRSTPTSTPAAGGHRHPPQAPVKPTGVLREREPEVRAALYQPQVREGCEREHDAEQRGVPHDHPEPG